MIAEHAVSYFFAFCKQFALHSDNADDRQANRGQIGHFHKWAGMTVTTFQLHGPVGNLSSACPGNTNALTGSRGRFQDEDLPA
jgi:hypothetical protein